MITSPTLFIGGRDRADIKRQIFALSLRESVDVFEDAYHCRQAFQLAQDIALGHYNGMGVRQTERGFLVDDYDLVRRVSPLAHITQKEAYWSRVGLVDSFLSLGYEVGMLFVDRIAYDGEVERVEWRDLELEGEIASVGRRHGKQATWFDANPAGPSDLLYLTWPRDFFTQVGDMLFVHPGFRGAFNARLMEMLGEHFKIERSYVGEGGYSLFGPDFVLIASSESISLTGLSDAHNFRRKFRDDLAKSGYPRDRMFHLPLQYSDLLSVELMRQLGFTERILLRGVHVDEEATVDMQEQRIAFNEAYWRENEGELSRLLDALRPRHDPTLYPDVNTSIGAIPLPNGGVLFDRAAEGPIAQKFVDDGWRVDFTNRAYFSYGPGGVARCASSVLWIPE